MPEVWEPRTEAVLAESLVPNDDHTVFTIKVREEISFHDGTPLNADAVMDNLNRNASGLLLSLVMKDLARNEDRTLVMEKLDDFTFTIATGRDGDPTQPVPWPTFPIYLTSLPGLIASPAWLEAVDTGDASPSEPVGTGPFVFDSYAPGDKLVVTRNPDYWMTDENGDQLPYLDEIEFRVIGDSQVRKQAFESGDVDLISTADTEVVNELAADDSVMTVRQDNLTETNYIMLHLTKPALADKSVRCALWQGLDGLYVDQQFFNWHSSTAAPDGELAVNFGRLNDPEISSLLEAARSEPDADTRRSLAEDINRRFASECFIIPTFWTQWAVHGDPAVQNIGRTPVPGTDRFMRDGAGSSGQVWLTSVFVAE